ncbi:hypothetical protein OC846_002463 [Tilletia horrida]|uniref:Uncharacterized protein n=1 Tax=Tilletia horrida TaxID=155126 RepID=A0AAN6GRW9_9BASI|nr:hypothetical protein OC846_002463 [Tilletia horrida]
MPLTALPGQAPGPQSTDQVLPSWLSYSAYRTITRTYTTTQETVLYDPSGLLAPSVSATVFVGVTTSTLYQVVPVPLLYTGPSPYPPLGTLFTVSGQSASPTQTESVTTGSSATATPAPTSSGSGVTSAPGQSSSGGPGSSSAAGSSQGQGSTASMSTPEGSSMGTTFLPSGTSIVAGTTFLPGPSGGSNTISVISGSTVGPTPAPTIISGTTFLPGSTSISDGTTFLPGSVTVFSGTTVFGGSSTVFPPATNTSPGTGSGPGGVPLERQGGLTPGQLAGVFVASILGFLLLLALLMCFLLRRQRRRNAKMAEQEKYQYGNIGVSNDAGGAGYGASQLPGAGEKSALLGAGAAGAGAGVASSSRSPWGEWVARGFSRGGRVPSDSMTGGNYTALPQANAGTAGGAAHRRSGSGGSSGFSGALAGASSAAVAAMAMAAISSRRRRRREEREHAGPGPWGARRGAVPAEEWEADELEPDGGSGFFVVGGRNAHELQTAERSPALPVSSDPFSDSAEDSSSAAHHRREGIAAAAGAAVVAAGRLRSIPPSSSSLLVSDPATDTRKSKFRGMANLGVGSGGPRFFGIMTGSRSASGTESGTGSGSNSGPSARNVSGGTGLTRPAGQPSVRSVSGPTYALPDQPTNQQPASGSSNVIYGFGAAAGAAALGLAHAARRVTSGERRLSRKPVPNYASSGNETDADEHASNLGKRKRAVGKDARGLYGAVGTGPGHNLDDDDHAGAQGERRGLMLGYDDDTSAADASAASPRRPSRQPQGPTFSSAGGFDIGEGWPESALTGAAIGVAAGGSGSRRSHRRLPGPGDAAQQSSGSGSGNGSGPWSSGSTHEVPKSSSGALLSGSSTGHPMSSIDGVGPIVSLNPPPRSTRSRASTANSPSEPSPISTFAKIASSSPDLPKLPAFPEGFGTGDLAQRAALAESRAAQASASAKNRGSSDSEGPSGATAMTAAAAGTAGSLALLAAQHRSSAASMQSQTVDLSSDGHGSRDLPGQGSRPGVGHSNFLSSGTDLLGPGASASSRSSVASGTTAAVPLAGGAVEHDVAAGPTATEFGQSDPRTLRSRASLAGGGLGRPLSTIFGSESEPSTGARPFSDQQHGSVSGSNSNSGPESAFDSLGARSGSVAVHTPSPARHNRGSGADSRAASSLLGALQNRQPESQSSPAGTFGVAELASPPGSPRRLSQAGRGRRVSGQHSARVSRSMTPGEASSASHPGMLGLIGADTSRPGTAEGGDLEAASAEDLDDESQEGGLLSSVAAGLRRWGGGWIPGAGRLSQPRSDSAHYPSIGAATMGVNTAVASPTGAQSPEPPGPNDSRRTSGVSSANRMNPARRSTATIQSRVGSREGSGSDPSGRLSNSASSRSLGAISGGSGRASHRTHDSSGNGSGSGSGGSRRSRGTAGSGASETTSELARRNTLSTHVEVDEDAARRASTSGANSPAAYTASEGRSAATSPALVPQPLGPAVARTLQVPAPARPSAAGASGDKPESTIRFVGRPASPPPALPSQLVTRARDNQPSEARTASGSWRESPRVATISQRASEAQARQEANSARGRSQTQSTGSPDEFEWGQLSDNFPTPLDRALREAEQRDLEEQAQGRSQTKYDWPKFLKF